MSLQLSGVVAAYDAAPVLHGIDLEVGGDEIVCLLGGNAAGKSSTMRAIVGVLPLRAGEIRFGGRTISGRAPAEVIASGIAIVPEGRRIFPRLTVLENLDLGAYGRRDGRAAVAADLDEVLSLFPRLGERASQLGGTLSGGEQQMLAIGRAMMSRPSLLLMDEPSMGLAPVLVDQVFEIIRAIHARGTAVFLVEQNARMALEVSFRGYVLQQGRIVASGSREELLASNEVRKAYLGA
ncbi:MAG TPA: ABC transporter ATP-binding protein [Deltaproteobacteria bacterium]|nr:ABC transporter ATP-binding protein [Deltaproteobacteria bacterium]HCP47062.1 ABC transporter ATP-binding protein [Deltaproteobacteria bacterium]